MMEGLYNGLIFLGIVQGFIFAIVAFTSKKSIRQEAVRI